MVEIFPTLIGNRALKDTLGADIRSGKAAHAYILSGPVGCGKHTAARLICAAIACTERDGDLPCGKCSQCHKMLTDISADVRYIRREDNRATIGVEQSRSIKEDLYVTPDYRGIGAGKALLKTIAQYAVQRQCGRLEWSVLDWNQPAIDFYEGLGAEVLPDWRICRLSGEALLRAAGR